MKLIIVLLILNFNCIAKKGCWICDRLSAPRGSFLDRATRVPEKSDAYRHTKPLREVKKVVDEKVLPVVTKPITPPKEVREGIQELVDNVRGNIHVKVTTGNPFGNNGCNKNTTVPEPLSDNGCSGNPLPHSFQDDNSNRQSTFIFSPDKIEFVGKCIEDANTGSNAVYVSKGTPCYSTFDDINKQKAIIKENSAGHIAANIIVGVFCPECLGLSGSISQSNLIFHCEELYKDIELHKQCYSQYPLSSVPKKSCLNTKKESEIKNRYKMDFEVLLDKYELSHEDVASLPENHEFRSDLNDLHIQQLEELEEAKKCQ